MLTRIQSCPQGLEFRERERPEILVVNIFIASTYLPLPLYLQGDHLGRSLKLSLVKPSKFGFSTLILYLTNLSYGPFQMEVDLENIIHFKTLIQPTIYNSR